MKLFALLSILILHFTTFASAQDCTESITQAIRQHHSEVYTADYGRGPDQVVSIEPISVQQKGRIYTFRVETMTHGRPGKPNSTHLRGAGKITYMVVAIVNLQNCETESLAMYPISIPSRTSHRL